MTYDDADTRDLLHRLSVLEDKLELDGSYVSAETVRRAREFITEAWIMEGSND
jgi:hypothetical protein